MRKAETSDDTGKSSRANRQRTEVKGKWASTLPYYDLCFRSLEDTFPSYSEFVSSSTTILPHILTDIHRKIGFPIFSIAIGPEGKIFKVQEKMLTEAAHYFVRTFNSGFGESASAAATFPKDDPEAWELLIEWAYVGKLPPLLNQADGTMYTEETTHSSWVRLKLCCLAEKYAMSLLRNLASILLFVT